MNKTIAKRDRRAAAPRIAGQLARGPSAARPELASPRARAPARERGRARLRIRTALPGDRPALASLRREAEEVHARLLPDYFRVSPVPGTVGIAASLSSVILVAEESGDESADESSVVGYVSVKIVETPRDPAMAPRRRAHIETVVVAEAHRGRGTGIALMRAAAGWAARRDAAELVLTVWSDNRAAEALYRRLGYQPIARVLRLPLD
jgi:ribosomal protein S18 acetylase RimI-like enzyme